jgi:hypothetical protein
MNILRTIRVASALALVLVAGACDNGGGTVAPSGNVTHTLITDAPFPFHRVARVDLYIVSVSASLSPDTGAGGSFVTLATPKRRVNWPSTIVWRISAASVLPWRGHCLDARRVPVGDD